MHIQSCAQFVGDADTIQELEDFAELDAFLQETADS
jgi:hypothetical protein